MEWSSAKNTSVKGVKNQLQDTIGGAAVRKALTNKDQNQESPKKVSIYEINPSTQLLRLSSSWLNFLIYTYDFGKESTYIL